MLLTERGQGFNPLPWLRLVVDGVLLAAGSVGSDMGAFSLGNLFLIGGRRRQIARQAKVYVCDALLFGQLGSSFFSVNPSSGWAKENWKFPLKDRIRAPCTFHAFMGDCMCPCFNVFKGGITHPLFIPLGFRGSNPLFLRGIHPFGERGRNNSRPLRGLFAQGV